MELRLSGKKSIFEEIAEQYKQYIKLGIVADGEKLPSCRELGLELGINPNTVERAYGLLESEGYVITLPKKGTYAVGKGSEDIEGLRGQRLKETLTQLHNCKLAGITLKELRKLLDEVFGEE